jgi:hypothetical protein
LNVDYGATPFSDTVNFQSLTCNVGDCFTIGELSFHEIFDESRIQEHIWNDYGCSYSCNEFVFENQEKLINCTSQSSVVIIPAFIKSIGKRVFSLSASIELKRGSLLSKIEADTFLDSKFIKITLPSSLKSIEVDAFQNMKFLQILLIVEYSIKVIPENAFRDYVKLQLLNAGEYVVFSFNLLSFVSVQVI